MTRNRLFEWLRQELKMPNLVLTKLIKASMDLPLTLTERDIDSSEPCSTTKCAYACCCRRMFPRSHVVIAKAYAYIIADGIVTQYRFGSGMREAARYNDNPDRGKPFAGRYWLNACSQRLHRKKEAQKQRIIRWLMEAGADGVNKRELERKYQEGPARISELNKAGYNIESHWLPGAKGVKYVFVSAPTVPIKPKPQNTGRKYRKTVIVTESRRRVGEAA